jgi:hypothetical protein
VKDYYGHQEQLFDWVAMFLIQAKEATPRKKILENQAAFWHDNRAVAKTELEIARLDAARAQQQYDFARMEVTRLQEHLDVLMELREGLSAALIGENMLDVVKVIGSIVAVVVTGTGLGAVVAAVGALAVSTKAMEDAMSFVRYDDMMIPVLTPEGEQLIGDLGDLVKGTKHLIDAGTTVNLLATATVKGEPTAPEPQILAAIIQTTFDMAMARFAGTRAALAERGAEQKLQAYEHGAAGLTALIDAIMDDQALVIATAHTMLREFQIYNDLFIRYHFLINRAFDLYTLPEESKTLASRFDFGHVHPDDEADVFDSLKRSDEHVASKVDGLLAQYLSSLRGILPDDTRNEYIEYTGDLDSVANVWNIDSAHVLEALRTTGVATFQITFEMIDSGRLQPAAELKIESISVGLIGVAASQGIELVTVHLVHTGKAHNRRFADVGSPFAVSSPPIEDRMRATLGAVKLNSFGEESKTRSWGRSPVATWQLKIATEANGGPDLSALTAVQLGIMYAFAAPAATT